jgi:hypothetical protein
MLTIDRIYVGCTVELLEYTPQKGTYKSTGERGIVQSIRWDEDMGETVVRVKIGNVIATTQPDWLLFVR